MRALSLEDLTLADGMIVSVEHAAGIGRLRFRDWREREFDIEFSEVDDFLNRDAAGTELDGVQMEDLAVQSGYRRFSFRSAWDDRTVLEVVAKSVHVRAVT